MSEIPEKSAKPTAAQSVQTSALSVLQTLGQVTQASWVQARPTLLQGIQVLTRSLQQWSSQLETQERNAQAQGSAPAKAIDWTPVKRLTDTVWTKAQPLWQKILTLLRPRLPESFQPLSDRSLSGILAGTLLLVLWFVSLVPSGQATPPPNNPIAINAPRSTSPQSSRQSRKTALSRDYSQGDESVPVAIPKDLSTPIATPVTLPIALPIAQSPPSLVKTRQSEPVNEPIAAQNPAPESLSPDAQKRAKLRQDLDVIAGSLLDGAIVGIRPQFNSHFLAMTLSDRWYNASESTQDKLANSLLVIAQGKGFNQIQLEASDGSVLARSPVVGDGMVVLQRTRS